MQRDDMTAMPPSAVFNWSTADSALFRQCPRAWFLQRIAALEDPGIAFAARLVPLAGWGQEVVRRILRDAIAAHAAGLAIPDCRILSQQALEMLRSQWRMSRAAAVKPDGNAPFVIMEHYCDRDGGGIPRDETDALKNAVMEAIEGFSASAIPGLLATLPPESVLANGGRCQIILDCNGERIPVETTTDLVIRTSEGGIQILSWHLGGESPSMAPLQNTCLALYAMKQWQAPLEKISAGAVMLNDGGRIRRFALTRDSLKNVAGMLKAEITRVRSLGNSPEAFPPAADDAICRQCRFRQSCPG